MKSLVLLVIGILLVMTITEAHSIFPKDMPNSCKKLGKILERSWHKSEGEKKFDERVDLNEDGYIDYLDLFEYASNAYDEIWCKNQSFKIK